MKLRFVQVATFVNASLPTLETEINDFLTETEGELVSVEFTTKYVSDAAAALFAAMVVYTTE